MILRGWASAALDNHDQGISELKTGLEKYVQTGAKIMLPYANALLSEALYFAGRNSEGRDVLQVLERVEPPSEVLFFAEYTNRIANRLNVAASVS